MEKVYGSSKSADELIEQVGKLSAQFVIHEDLLPENISEDETSAIYELSATDLKSRYPARYERYLGMLRKYRNRSDDSSEYFEQSERFFGMLNSFKRYMDALDADPSSTILFETQVPAIRALYKHLEGHTLDDRAGYIRMPTGSGKTVLFVELAKILGLRTLVVTPTLDLVDQTKREFEDKTIELDIGVVSGQEKTIGKDITITTYSSLIINAKRGSESLLQPANFDLIILDEAHHSLGVETRRAIGEYEDCLILGFTASPNFNARTDGSSNNHQKKRSIYHVDRELAEILPHEIYSKTTAEAVKEGMLCPVRTVLVKTTQSLGEIPLRNNEYDTAALEEALNTYYRNGLVIELYQKYFSGEKGIAFCAGINHAESLAQALREAGIRSEAISSNTPSDLRKELITRFGLPYRDPNCIQILTNDRLLTEGFDQPEASVCFSLRPTGSVVMSQQRSGRVLRKNRSNPGKVATIVEFIDQNHQYLPVLFSDRRVGGGVSVGNIEPLKQKWYRALDGRTLEEGGSIVSSKSKIQATVDQIKQQIELRDLSPPENWETITDLAERTQVSASLLTGQLHRISRDEGEWYHLNSGMFRGNSRHKRFISPELAEKIIAQLDMPPLAPKGWRTAEQFSAIYGINVQNARYALSRSIFGKTHNYRFCSEQPGKRTRRMFFSPEAQEHAAKELEVVYSGDYAPEAWISRQDLVRKFGGRRLDFMISTMLYRQPGLQAHRGEFVDRIDGTEQEYFSERFVSYFSEVRMKPPNWVDLKHVCEENGFSVAAGEKLVAAATAAKKSLKKHVIFNFRGDMVISPTLANVIKEEGFEKSDRNIDLASMTVTHSNGGWVRYTRGGNTVIDALLGKSRLIKQAFFQQSSISTRFLKLVASTPTLRAIADPDWYSMDDICQGFSVKPENVRRETEKLYKKKSSRIIRLQFGPQVEYFMPEDDVSDIIHALGL